MEQSDKMRTLNELRKKWKTSRKKSFVLYSEMPTSIWKCGKTDRQTYRKLASVRVLHKFPGRVCLCVKTYLAEKKVASLFSLRSKELL